MSMALRPFAPNDPNDPRNRNTPNYPETQIPTPGRVVAGSGGMGRPAFQSDMTQSNEARGLGMKGVGLSLDAAQGNAPSRAEILARRMGDDSVDASLATSAGTRGGPMAQASAMRAPCESW